MTKCNAVLGRQLEQKKELGKNKGNLNDVWTLVNNI